MSGCLILGGCMYSCDGVCAGSCKANCEGSCKYDGCVGLCTQSCSYYCVSGAGVQNVDSKI